MRGPAVGSFGVVAVVLDRVAKTAALAAVAARAAVAAAVAAGPDLRIGGAAAQDLPEGPRERTLLLRWGSPAGAAGAPPIPHFSIIAEEKKRCLRPGWSPGKKGKGQGGRS